jgi:hypothetical protein
VTRGWNSRATRYGLSAAVGNAIGGAPAVPSASDVVERGFDLKAPPAPIATAIGSLLPISSPVSREVRLSRRSVGRVRVRRVYAASGVAAFNGAHLGW